MSSVQDEVVMWRGRLVSEMTRDELAAAFQQLARIHRDQKEAAEEHFTTFRRFREARMSGPL
jgi:hypothetical protein